MSIHPEPRSHPARAREIGGTALLVSMLPYESPARLAVRLGALGVRVEALCEGATPLADAPGLARRHRLGVLRAVTIGPIGAARTLARAVRRSRADLVVPCDDQAVETLHLLHRRNPSLRAVVERSLGDPANYPVLARRSRQLAVARSLGLRTPRGFIVQSVDDLRARLRELGGKAVLKRDRTWGGAGVTIVETPAAALSAYAHLRRAHTLSAAAAISRSHGSRYALSMMSRQAPAIELQEFVEGAPCSRAVVCRDGEVLCGATFRAVETTSPTGPASVFDPIENVEIDRAASALARRFTANGLLGFDFVVDAAGRAHFLEVNPRFTPAAVQRELLEALGRGFLGHGPDVSAAAPP